MTTFFAHRDAFACLSVEAETWQEARDKFEDGQGEVDEYNDEERITGVFDENHEELAYRQPILQGNSWVEGGDGLEAVRQSLKDWDNATPDQRADALRKAGEAAGRDKDFYGPHFNEEG